MLRAEYSAEEQTMQDAQEFWNERARARVEEEKLLVEFPDRSSPVYKRALAHFGELRGKTLIDLGCGGGASSLFFASLGAEVISIDLSTRTIDNLKLYCIQQRIHNIRPMVLAAQDIATLPPADFMFGAMILHHIEPFDQFAAAARQAIKPGGRAFFFENNSASAVMMWFRKHVVGKLWVPKYGDQDEWPLAPYEVDHLRKHFNVVAEFPEMVFAQMVSLYLLRGRLRSLTVGLDNVLGRYPAVRKYSYRQYLCLS
jgi:2-polyprenyl-3-methyl-5-hydroxy-6-metoxy-1,4-benzoquinol methylase